MSRNNSRRQRTKQKQPPQANIPPQAPANPFAAAFVVPTEIVDLPTRGLFYSEDNPLYQLESLEIKHMTAREEDILGNQDFISRGIVLDKLIEAILIDKSIKINDLADIDKIAILTAARKTGYGDEYKQRIACEECGVESVFIFSMENLINNANAEAEEREGSGEFEMNPDSNTFNVDLDASGYTAVCRQLNSDDFGYISDLEKQRKKHSLDFNYTIEFLRRMVLSVHKTENPSDITSEPGIISQFLEYIPAQDSRKMKVAHSYLTPTFRLHEEVACPNCSDEREREVPFSWAMFWSDI